MSSRRVNFRFSFHNRSSGYTLVEILIAVTLTLMLMTGVVRVFSGVGDGISKLCKALEAFDRLRAAGTTLRQDLSGVTVTMQPPWRVEEGKGYFEYIEGGDWQIPVPPLAPTKPQLPPANLPFTSDSQAYDSDSKLADTTAGERGDILMFTTHNAARPFTGLLANTIIQSDVAEVAWFIRGHTLHRRVLLISPGSQSTVAGQSPDTFFQTNDISVRMTNNGRLIVNTLSDLTKRENRFAHPADYFPFDARRWGMLGLPTLLECSAGWMSVNIWPSNNWEVGTIPFWVNPTALPVATLLPSAQATSLTLPAQLPSLTVPNFVTLPTGTYGRPVFDLWQGICGDGTANNFWIPDWYLAPGGLSGNYFTQPYTALAGTRVADDVILTNVLGFDVKAWDPGAPLYADPIDSSRPAVKPGDVDYASIANKSVSTRPPPIAFGAYVDLGWAAYDPNYNDPVYNPISGIPPPAVAPRFWHYGQLGTNTNVGLSAKPTGTSPPQPPVSRVYDTFPSSYENEGIYSFGIDRTTTPATVKITTYATGGASTNGFDNDGDGIVNNPTEQITSPPYPVPLRGIQVKIRVFEPDSRQIREVTIEQDFLPK